MEGRDSKAATLQFGYDLMWVYQRLLRVLLTLGFAGVPVVVVEGGVPSWLDDGAIRIEPETPPSEAPSEEPETPPEEMEVDQTVPRSAGAGAPGTGAPTREPRSTAGTPGAGAGCCSCENNWAV